MKPTEYSKLFGFWVTFEPTAGKISKTFTYLRNCSRKRETDENMGYHSKFSNL